MYQSADFRESGINYRSHHMVGIGSAAPYVKLVRRQERLGITIKVFYALNSSFGHRTLSDLGKAAKQNTFTRMIKSK